MKKRLVLNDIKNNKLLAVTTLIFMTVSSFLFALTCLLFADLFGAMDKLMDNAKTPDFVQMHAGAFDEDRVEQFAESNEAVLKYQTIGFLNLDNGIIYLDDESLSDSTQDNGLAVQSSCFDFLLDTNNNIIEVENGTVYVPVCYRSAYDIEIGDNMQIGDYNLTVAGFVRDSQMNSMMASSKRFLVSSSDYETLTDIGSEEYLIEFLLKDNADITKFSNSYIDAELPMNGPTITKSLLKLMNALSDGMMVLIIFLISVIMLLISILCIRFTLLTKLEEDRNEIGLLKAVGLGKKSLRNIYLVKYLVLSATGTIVGLVIAYIGKIPLQASMQELYGNSDKGFISFIAAVLGVIIMEYIILLSINRTVKKSQKLSAVEALTGTTDSKTKRLGVSKYIVVILVIAAGVFLMAVPQNIYSTISSSKFVTYMGIGNGEVRIDIRQTNSIQEKTAQVEKLLSYNEDVEEYISLTTRSYQITRDDDTIAKVNIELGDHTIFPVNYVSGHAPVSDNEIAMSYLCADELEVELGDSIEIMINGRMEYLELCGIYSDMTNGGKTAKAVFTDENAPIMWSIIYASLSKDVDNEQWSASCEAKLNEEDINAKVTPISEYVNATYGQTIEQVKLAGRVAIIVAVLIIITVVFLFVRLLIAKERNDISLKRALGFGIKAIKKQYMIRYAIIIVTGIVVGVLLGNLLGEMLVGGIIGSMGAAGFRFIIDNALIYVMIPVLTFISAGVAVILGLKKTKSISASECCKSRV